LKVLNLIYTSGQEPWLLWMSLLIFLLCYRFPFSIWLHCSSSTDVTGCKSGSSYNRGHSGWHSPTSTEIYWMLSTPWNSTEGMGCLLWV